MEDLAAARLLLRTDSAVRWAPRFHRRQAAEKASTSLLVLTAGDPPRGHALWSGLLALTVAMAAQIVDALRAQ
jgi:HEPN domain-containing protein